MPFDGSGNFNRDRGPDTWKSDAEAGIRIKSDLHDINDNDLANGLSLALLKDGQSSPTADINWNGKKITNLGAPVNPTDAATKAYADADVTHSLPLKDLLVDLDEIQIANSESIPQWQRAKVTAANLRASVTPIGFGGDYWGDVAPPGWLFAYGQAVSRTTYAKLFTKLGTVFGTGDGTTTFNLPDKRGRASFGKDDMGGTSADRLTALAGGINGDTLGAVGGEQGHVMTIAELASHDHTPGTGGESTDHVHSGSTSASGDHIHSGNGGLLVGLGGNYSVNPSNGSQTFGSTTAAGNHAHSFTTGGRNVGHTHAIYAQGGNAAHNTVPPGIVCNYIIYAGG